MHDDRTLVEGRLERALHQFVRPAQYAARLPLAVSVWHVPGEPVPVAEALGADFVPFTAGTEWGKPWSTSWFRLRGRCPGSGRGAGWRWSSTRGSRARGRGSRRKGCCTTIWASP